MTKIFPTEEPTTLVQGHMRDSLHEEIRKFLDSEHKHWSDFMEVAGKWFVARIKRERRKKKSQP